MLFEGLLIFGIGLFLLYRFQRRLLYYPSSMANEDEAQFYDGYAFERGRNLHQVDFCTADNERLKSLLCLCPKSASLHSHSNSNDSSAFSTSKDTPPTLLLFFHGNAGNVNYRIPNAARILRSVQNCSVLLVGYRGYPGSGGEPSERGLILDAEAALDWARDEANGRRFGFDWRRIVVFGRSLGAAVAIALGQQRPECVRALVVENTFTSIPDMIGTVFPLLAPLKFLCKDTWRNIDRIASIQCPLLAFSSLNDQLVPCTHMRTLFDAAVNAKPRRLVKFSHGTHMDLYLFVHWYEHLNQFIQSL
jgi:abhydrolase domain-containing protein 13